MKHILKAINAQMKLIKEDLDWHKREYNQFRDAFHKEKRKTERLEVDLKAANAIIEELREQLNNK